MSTNRLIAEITGEGFTARILEYPDLRVDFTGDADIDADGANGQHGTLAAYMLGNAGSEDLANGGMGIQGGRVVGTTSWFRDIVILGPDGQPKVFPGGIVASKTAYRIRGMSTGDPAAYLDAQTIAYIVVPPEIIAATAGAVLGCRARVTNLKNGKVSEAVVGDVGPRRKVGELSIQLALDLGLRSSPRNGGTEEQIIKYELWPGKVSLRYPELPLLRSNGTYV